MQQLFAAPDDAGAIRFVDEVPRGAACGCFCPVCSAPLVAKQGRELQWHFAHEGGQERVDCEVGAANLLRRLAVDHLRTLRPLVLPRFILTVHARSTFRVHSKEISWDAQPRRVEWIETPAQDAPVATLSLDNGVQAELYVEVGSPSSFPSAARGRLGRLIFRVLLPRSEELRNRAATMAYIARTGALEWNHQPDVFGLVETGRKEMQKLAEEDERLAKIQAQQQAAAAGRRWAEIARRSAGGANVGLPDQLASERRVAPPAPRVYAWAPGHVPRASFIFYRLRDETAWVLYSRGEDRCGVVPWPAMFEGWDESLPPSVGIANSDLGVYEGENITAAMIYLSRQSTLTRNDSNPEAFRGL